MAKRTIWAIVGFEALLSINVILMQWSVACADWLMLVLFCLVWVCLILESGNVCKDLCSFGSDGWLMENDLPRALF